MGKKKQALMDEMEPKFIQGCIDNEVGEQVRARCAEGCTICEILGALTAG